jgi:hypothetical protein
VFLLAIDFSFLKKKERKRKEKKRKEGKKN